MGSGSQNLASGVRALAWLSPHFMARMFKNFMEIQLMFEATKIYHFVSPVYSLSLTQIETEPEKL
jgi:hypothetical protein